MRSPPAPHFAGERASRPVARGKTDNPELCWPTERRADIAPNRIAEGKGSRREVGSERSRRRTAAPANMNRIGGPGPWGESATCGGARKLPGRGGARSGGDRGKQTGLILGSIGQSHPLVARLDSVTVCDAIANSQDPSDAVHGLITAIPQCAKSSTFLVASAASLARAMAAIWQSASRMGRPKDRREAATAA